MAVDQSLTSTPEGPVADGSSPVAPVMFERPEVAVPKTSETPVTLAIPDALCSAGGVALNSSGALVVSTSEAEGPPRTPLAPDVSLARTSDAAVLVTSTPEASEAVSPRILDALVVSPNTPVPVSLASIPEASVNVSVAENKIVSLRPTSEAPVSVSPRPPSAVSLARTPETLDCVTPSTPLAPAVSLAKPPVSLEGPVTRSVGTLTPPTPPVSAGASPLVAPASEVSPGIGGIGALLGPGALTDWFGSPGATEVRDPRPARDINRRKVRDRHLGRLGYARQVREPGKIRQRRQFREPREVRQRG